MLSCEHKKGIRAFHLVTNMARYGTYIFISSRYPTHCTSISSLGKIKKNTYIFEIIKI